MLGCVRIGRQQPLAFPLDETVEQSASAVRSGGGGGDLPECEVSSYVTLRYTDRVFISGKGQ